MKLLLENDAKVDTTFNGTTPLLLAANNGHEEIVKHLIEHGAKIDPSQKGTKPIHYAANQGHIKTIEVFMQQDIQSTHEILPQLQSHLLFLAKHNCLLEWYFD